MVVATAIAGVGLATQIYGSYKAGKDQAAAMRRQAALDRIKAEEILSRNRQNINAIFKDAKTFQATQVTQLTAAGGGLGASALALIEETATLAAEEARSQSRAAEWEANMVRFGASSIEFGAGQVEDAAAISVLGTGLSGASDIFKDTRGQTAPSKT